MTKPPITEQLGVLSLQLGVSSHINLGVILKQNDLNNIITLANRVFLYGPADETEIRGITSRISALDIQLSSQLPERHKVLIAGDLASLELVTRMRDEVDEQNRFIIKIVWLLRALVAELSAIHIVNFI